MTFRQQSALATAAVIVLIYGAHLARLMGWLPGVHSDFGEVFVTLVAFVAAIAVAHVVLAIHAAARRRGVEPADERDRVVGWRAGRNAHLTVMIGLWALPLLILLPVSGVLVANLALALLVGSELCNQLSLLAYYRRT